MNTEKQDGQSQNELMLGADYGGKIGMSNTA